MEIVKDFISNYGTTILYSILAGIASYIGIAAKNLYKKYVTDQEKKDVVKTVVSAIEQLYHNLRGDEKLQKALEAAAEMLSGKGITVSDVELRLMIESAVEEFNDTFHKKEPAETVTEEVIEEETVTEAP